MGRGEYKSMMETTTVSAGSGRPEMSEPIHRQPAEAMGEQAGWPLSFGQQRLWFLDQLAPDSALYNMPCALRATGPFDLAAFKQALHALTARHEMLRARFVTHDGQPRQIIESQVEFPLRIIECPDLDESERITRQQDLIRDETNQPCGLRLAPHGKWLTIAFGA